MIHINSKERRENRYIRRKNKREKKKMEFYSCLPSYEEIFSYNNLYEAFDNCRKNVAWKDSIQKFRVNKMLKIFSLCDKLMNDNYESSGFNEFYISERGKTRHICSVNIEERVVQKTLCDEFLVELLSHNLIHDNGATIKNKGTTFTLKRLRKHLYSYYKENKSNDGYIVLFDFSDYFNTINHEILFNNIDKMILDDRTKDLVHHFVENFGENGLGLGSQVSQICAVAYPNFMDHYFKDLLGVKYYGRYMDDGYIITDSREKAYEYIEYLYESANKLKLSLNPKKIKIAKIGKTFTFLKKRIFISPNGKIVMKLNQKSITRERHRIKALGRLYYDGIITKDTFIQSYKSWEGWAKQFNNYKSLIDINNLFQLILNGKEDGSI